MIEVPPSKKLKTVSLVIPWIIEGIKAIEAKNRAPIGKIRFKTKFKYFEVD